MIFAPTISILENHITKAYNCRQTSLVWLQTTFTMIQIQRPWPWQSVNTLARTELIKGCNPSRYSLALPNEFPMGLFNVFSSGNGMRNTRWWESKACSIRSGFRRDPRPTLQTWVKSRSDTYIIGSTKSSIYAVDRCSDNISMWITRFRHVWFPMESLSESKRKCNMYCVKINKSLQVLLLSVYFGTTDVVSSLYKRITPTWWSPMCVCHT